MKFTLATILTLAATAAAVPTYSSYGSGSSNQGYSSGTSDSNTGSYNSGSTNSGTGSYNSGSSNTGTSNSGSYNSGNTGSTNSGSYNSGSTGSSNTGSYNSGSSNVGSYNSGTSGSSNTGYSSGSSNTGSYGSGSSTQTSYNSKSSNKQSLQTAYCDTGSAQVSVDQTVTNGLFSVLNLQSTILGLVSQCNNQILSLGSSSAAAQKQVFTQNLVAHMRQQYPSHSVVVCPHGSYSFDSTPIQKSTVQCSTTSGSSNYDVIVFDKGTFNLHGSGGFSNWAYVPNTSCQCSGNTVAC